MTAQMAMRLTLRMFKHKKGKVSIVVFDRKRDTGSVDTENLFHSVDADGDGFLIQSEVQEYEGNNNLVDEWNDMIQLDEDGKLTRHGVGGGTHVIYGKVLSQNSSKIHSKVYIYFLCRCSMPRPNQ